MKVLLVYGGASPEHEVSIRSAHTIFAALSERHEVFAAYVDKQNRWVLVNGMGDDTGDALTYDKNRGVWLAGAHELNIDVVFPIIHGVGGEDGALQELLDGYGVAYVGTKAHESRLCFDKVATKAALKANGLHVVDELIVRSSEEMPSYRECVDSLGTVLFVKPSRSGSSIGVHKVSDETTYEDAVRDAFLYDDTILIEPAVEDLRELEVAVLEAEPGVYEVSVPGEIVADDAFYSYSAKYDSDSMSETIVNPEMSEELRQELKESAHRVNKALGCRGMVRVDFLRDGKSGTLYANEVNTLPGFTSISMYPMLWEGTGVSLEELLDTMINVAKKDGQ